MRRKVPGGSRNKHYQRKYNKSLFGEPVIRKATDEEKIIYDKILAHTYKPEGCKCYVKVTF